MALQRCVTWSFISLGSFILASKELNACKDECFPWKDAWPEHRQRTIGTVLRLPSFSLTLSQKTDASATSIPSFEPPPVPPLPLEHQRTTPVGSPIAEIFSTTGTLKPLPPIMDHHRIRDASCDDPDDRSMVFIDKIPRTPSPNPSHKRRSMSLGENELQKAMPLSPASEIRPEASAADTSVNGVLNDFRGELSSSLDPNSSPTLDLHNPSRPNSYAKPKLNGDAHSVNQVSSKHSPLLTPITPTLTIHPSQNDDSVRSSPPSAIVPPRFSSLQTPARSIPARQGLSPLRTRSGNTFNNQGLHVLHRSTASSSEPSLVPSGDDARVSECPLFHSQGTI